jgi:hypothetical protein
LDFTDKMTILGEPHRRCDEGSQILLLPLATFPLQLRHQMTGPRDQVHLGVGLDTFSGQQRVLVVRGVCFLYM